jgi:hypothetical protein
MAFFCRCRDVTSSDVLMDYLLQDRREVVEDGALQVWGQSLPDCRWINGHSASHSPATVRRFWSASLVSLGLLGPSTKFTTLRLNTRGVGKIHWSPIPKRSSRLVQNQKRVSTAFGAG